MATGAAPSEPRPLSPPLTACLDALRVVAALWVAASHLRGWGLVPAPLAAWLPIEGHDAVIVFFVLSGFLISHAAARARDGWIGFVIDRASRLYSVVVPILLATWLVDSIGGLVAPDLYAGHYEWRKPWLYLPFHLLFLGDSWSLREVPTSIPPYWSLNYEAWYYVAFAILVFADGKRRVLLLAALAFALGPQHLLLWPVWACGVALHRGRERIALGRRGAVLLLLACLAAYAALETAGIDHALWRIGETLYVAAVGDGPGNARHFLADYLVAVLVAGTIIAVERIAWTPPAWLARALRAAAGYSFTLYLVHAPFLLTLRMMVEPSRLTPVDGLAIVAGLCLATVLVGQVTEKRRDAWRRALRAALGRPAPAP